MSMQIGFNYDLNKNPKKNNNKFEENYILINRLNNKKNSNNDFKEKINEFKIKFDKLTNNKILKRNLSNNNINNIYNNNFKSKSYTNLNNINNNQYKIYKSNKIIPKLNNDDLNSNLIKQLINN